MSQDTRLRISQEAVMAMDKPHLSTVKLVESVAAVILCRAELPRILTGSHITHSWDDMVTIVKTSRS